MRALFKRLRDDRGLTTAEYAVGTLAACGFAGVLFKILTSVEIFHLLLGLIERSLGVTG